MGGESVQRVHSLKKRLLQESFTFEFAQAVKLLLSNTKNMHGDILQDTLHFRTVALLSAPPSDIIRIRELPPGPGTHGDCYQMVTTFFGLAGPHGPLPIAHTEEMIRRIKCHDNVMADFLDLFNHRLLSLFFFLAKKKSPTLSWLSPEHHLQGDVLTSLAGASKVQRKPLVPRSFIEVARFFWQRPRNAQGLRSVLENYFGVPCAADSFCGSWMPAPRALRTPLAKGLTLGQRSLLGERVWSQNAGLRVTVCVASSEKLMAFLPGGKSHLHLVQMIKAYVGCLAFFRLAFRFSCQPRWVLGGPADKVAMPMRLGWTSWLKASAQQAEQTRITMHQVFGLSVEGEQ